MPWVSTMPSEYGSMELEEGLINFLSLYSKEITDGTPGCRTNCEDICKIEGLRELDDLRQLAKRTWLGEYFPAKVALRFENAFDSPEFEEEYNKIAKAEAIANKLSKPWSGTFHFKTTIDAMEVTETASTT